MVIFYCMTVDTVNLYALCRSLFGARFSVL
jgi:hypothetical protein